MVQKMAEKMFSALFRVLTRSICVINPFFCYSLKNIKGYRPMQYVQKPMTQTQENSLKMGFYTY